MLRIAEHFDVEVVCHTVTVSAQVQDMWLCQLTGVPCRMVPREKRSGRTVSHGLEAHEKRSPHLVSN